MYNNELNADQKYHNTSGGKLSHFVIRGPILVTNKTAADNMYKCIPREWNRKFAVASNVQITNMDCSLKAWQSVKYEY